MSFQPSPVEIADEILQVLKYTGKTELDEFSLKRYIHKLLEIKSRQILNPKEYVALGLLFFSEGKYDEFQTILREGMEAYEKDLFVSSHYHIGMFSIVQFGLVDIQFDLYDEWFHHPSNLHKEPLSFLSSASSAHLGSTEYRFIKDMRINLSFLANRTIDLKMGPRKKNVGYDDMKAIKFDFPSVMLVDFINRWACNGVNEAEVHYIHDILGDVEFRKIEKLVKAVPTDETNAAIESDDLDDEYDSIDELFAAVCSD